MYDNCFSTGPFPLPCEQKPTLKTEIRFELQQSNILKWHMAGINSHFATSIDKQLLWFADYVNAKEDDAAAQVAIFFRIDRRTDTLHQNLIDSQNMEKRKNNRDDCATHLVTQVVYGVEFIFSIRRSIDRQRETKENVERSIYLAAKTYFDQAAASNWIHYKTPVELENVTCSILCSLSKEIKPSSSFRESTTFLREVISVCIKEDNWRPIEIVLRYIPSQTEICSQLTSKLLSEKKIDINIEVKRNNDLWKWITTEFYDILNHPYFGRFLAFQRAFQFQKNLVNTRCLNTSNRLIGMRNTGYPKVLEHMKVHTQDLIHIKDWLIHRRDEIETAYSFLKGTTLLTVLDLEEIERKRKNIFKDIKVFVLKVNYVAKPVVKDMRKIFHINNQEIKNPISYFLFSTSSHLTRKDLIKLNKICEPSLRNQSKIKTLLILSAWSRLTHRMMMVAS